MSAERMRRLATLEAEKADKQPPPPPLVVMDENNIEAERAAFTSKYGEPPKHEIVLTRSDLSA